MTPSVLHVLFADPASLLGAGSGATACLDDVDRQHVARFRFARDREIASASRVLQRLSLARATGEADFDPGRFRFATDASGKPHVDAPAAMRSWHFSASNTIGLVACAVSAHCRIGLDVERKRDQVTEDLLASCCTEAERAELARCGGQERNALFTALWTHKEAYLKARGIGLALAPSAIGFARGEGNSLRISGAPGDAAGEWRVFPLDAGDGHAAAVCAPGSAAFAPAIDIAWACWREDRFCFSATRP